VNESKRKIERMYQRAMNLRDSTWQAIDFEPIETEYTHQYMHAFRVTQDVATFQRQTREYTALLRAYRKTSLVQPSRTESDFDYPRDNRFHASKIVDENFGESD
jgi:hypothetical protein